MRVRPAKLLLNEMYAAFIQSGVSIIAASIGPENKPLIARAVGCRVSPDRSRVTIYMPSVRATELIESIRTGAPLAVVFTLPSTHHAIQLKSSRAKITPIEQRDFGMIQKYADAFVADVQVFGFSEAFIRALVAFDRDDLVAVTFTPESAFQQTPGPAAGIPLNG